LLSEYLASEGYTERGIAGARVSKIEKRGHYLMPYIDGIEYCEDLGDSFLLGSGRIRCSNTEGLIECHESAYCDDCGESYDLDNMTMVNESCVCQYCLSENYIYSELMDSYLTHNEAESNGDGEYATSRYFERNGYVLDYVCVWQVESDCVEFDGEYYHESDYHVLTVDGVSYHEDSLEYQEALEAKELKDAAYQTVKTVTFDWTLNPYEYEKTPYLGLTTKTEKTLRDNYQLDEKGNPERIADFLNLLDITPEMACA
jgi:hypothetical protein